MEWISIIEKLPTIKKNGFSKYVLGSMGGFWYESVRITPGGIWKNPSELKRRVQSWMPLPEPPPEDTT